MMSFSANQSWSHGIAVRRAMQRYQDLEQALLADEGDSNLVVAVAAEVLFWICTAEEASDAILLDVKTKSGTTYAEFKKSSQSGRKMLAAQWARNKITHCLVMPVMVDRHLEGGELCWADQSTLLAEGLKVGVRTTGAGEYVEFFAGRPVRETLQACVWWIAEVKFDVRDRARASAWLEAKVARVS